jgi:glyoxylase-like metal-dependent hydrolase (beta-lactamase superfamily II)
VSASDPPFFELFAIRYAVHSGRSAGENFIGGDSHDQGSNLDYFVWLARRGAEVVLVDTGFGPEAATQRRRTLLRRPSEGLALLGIDAADISTIVLTHLHYDHAGGLAEYPNAVFHVQEREASYATGPCMCHARLRDPYDVEDTVRFVRNVYAERVVFHRDTSELLPGMTLHRIGGHTAGLQAVRVWTRRGWVMLASDASHLYENMRHGLPFPIVHNVGDMLEGYRTLRRLADSEDHIVPGHDPLVMQLYPAPRAELEGIVVRLDVPPTRPERNDHAAR